MDFTALDAFQRDPYPHYARARDEPGLAFSPELDAWLVSRYADVREALARHEDLSSAGALRPDTALPESVRAELAKGIGGGGVVLSSDGEAHRRYRQPHNRGLSASSVAALRPFIAERTTRLVDEFAGDGGAELMGTLARRLPGARLRPDAPIRMLPTLIHRSPERLEVQW